MKWEPAGHVVDWCEGSLCTNSSGGEPKLLMNGVSYQSAFVMKPTPDLKLWDRWVDRESPNARFGLRSTIPNLVGKAAWYSSCADTRMNNVRSIVRGMGYKGYPWRWWWPSFSSKVNALGLKSFFPLLLCSRWFVEGKSMTNEPRDP